MHGAVYCQRTVGAPDREPSVSIANNRAVRPARARRRARPRRPRRRPRRRPAAATSTNGGVRALPTAQKRQQQQRAQHEE
jgi:hypothetical protein